MTSSVILDEKQLKRIPPALVFILILILGLPVIALNYFGMDFSALAKNISATTGFTSIEVEAQIRGYFRQSLLEWSAFSFSAITVLLSFTQFRLKNDKIALIIGLSVLFSGSVAALHTVIIDGLTPHFTDQKNLDAFIWTFANSVSGLIFIVGLLLVLNNEDGKVFRVSTFFLLNFFLLIVAFTLIYYAASRAQLPQMWSENSVISRPYEFIYMFIFFILIIFIYPPVYKKHPYILTNCIFYMGITQIITAIYLMLLSSSPYDSGYNIGYFLKIIFYFIPFSCLIINYVFSYNAIILAQRKLKLSQEKFQYLASHDVLTNLYNRREFEALLSKTIANNSRSQSSFALFVIDIDNFKSINDTLGHIQGDRFLQQFSEHLSRLTRQGDILSRIGGDEYTLITSRIESSTAIRKLAERMVEGLNIPFPVSGKLLTCTVSIGIAIYPLDGDDTEELFKHADVALYSAKKSGKNTYRFYEDKLSYLQHREAEIESYLREALESDELFLNFQPKFDIISKKIIGAEVLLRWHNDVLGDVQPDEFIPVAENTGLIINIGEWVLAQTCKRAKAWLTKYNKPIIFSINVSPLQFENQLFFNKLNETLQHYDYPPSLLEIEVTENLLMNDDTDVSEGLRKIGQLGVNISIDDFGIGYSSLSRLRSLPIKTIKIDKFFISDIKDEKSSVVIVDTIIKLAEQLGMDIIAEGIETQIQVNYLVDKKCYQAQGFLFSKPLGAQEFQKLAYGESVTEQSDVSE